MLSTAYRNALVADAPLKWTDAFLVASTSAVGLSLALVAVYLTKSALGIDLMPGPSLLHDLLYWMVV